MNRFSLRRMVSAALILMVIPVFISAQANKEAVQKEVKDLHKKALEAAANIFSEKEFKTAEEEMKDAEEYAKDPAEAESMMEKYKAASDNFKIALENSKNIAPNFAQLMKTRQLVLSIGVDVSGVAQWKEGEENFVSAVEDFVDKDNDGVKKYTAEAEKLYKEAEMIAIMEKYHGSLLTAIEKAEDEGVEKFAPKTLAKIKQFAKDIETALTANRYDTLKARGFLNNANYELSHALYMQRVFSAMQKEDKTFEDLQLFWEEPLAKIGSVFGIVRSFDKGYEDYTSAVIDNINAEKGKLAASVKTNENLTAELNSLKKSHADLIVASNAGKVENQKLIAQTDSLKKVSEELGKLRDELTLKIASIESEKSQYKTQVDESQKVKGQIESLKALFLPSEAEIVTSGDLVSIRLLNINFPANKAAIDPQYYNLLAKVQKSIKLFPGAPVSIEGHTDGMGDYQKNIETSRARATAVYQYLLSTMGSEAGSITVVGLGGSKPIANNNTEEGRAQNRRIEVVINTKNAQ